MERNERAKYILRNVTYATIATASLDAQPWNTPVHVVFDEKFNMYWTSLKDTKHSANIRENPRVYVSVYEPVISEKDGVYLQGQAEELSDPNKMSDAITLLYEKRGKSARTPEEFLGNSERRIYVMRPERFWISLDADAKINPGRSKTEIHIL